MATKKKKELVDITMLGKMSPRAMESEKRVLGILLMHNHVLEETLEIIQHPEFFYVDAHQFIYSAMLTLKNENMVVDCASVFEQMVKDETAELAGGYYYMTQLTEGTVNDSSMATHARLVAEKYMLRELIKVCGNVVHQAYEPSIDCFDLIDLAETGIMGVNSFQNGKYEHIMNGTLDVFKKIEALRHSDQELTGVPSGFRDLDALTCGWQSPDLIILAARPSVGKTAFALNMARFAAIHFQKTAPAKTKPNGVGFFSLEMSTAQLIQRLLSIESGIDLKMITRGKLDDPAMEDLKKRGFAPVSKMPLFIDDTPGLNIYEFKNKVRRMYKKDGVRIVFLDYLQLMNGLQPGRDENREREISKISRELKGLAKELNIPIIALSQMSRQVENRKGNEPIMSDLRESGAIEQDADVVAFLYRPEYHGTTHNENGSTSGQTFLTIKKHRSGALDRIELRAELSIQVFKNKDDQGEFFQTKEGWKPAAVAQNFSFDKKSTEYGHTFE